MIAIILGLTALVLPVGPAVAGPVNVTFTTGGTTYMSNGVTETPAGNVLAVGGQSAVSSLSTVGQTSSPFQVLFQSQLQFNSASTGQALSVPGYFTITGSFFETATLTGSSSIALNLAPGMATTFNIYYNSTPGSSPNSGAGTGFQPGSPIFTGTIGASSGSFAVTQPTTVGPFEPNNTSDTKQALAGTGLTNITVNETSYNSSFFNTNLTGTMLGFQISTNTQFITAGANASSNFFGTTPYLPTINGTLTGNTAPPGPNGYDIQFQSNGSGSFMVPEPATLGMTLLGLGGLGLGTLRSRRRATSAA
jgi:hypothetical protein